MARYIGPVCKLCRREGIKLFLKGTRCASEKCGLERRPYPPGEHGRRRTKETEYKVQLREKQRAKRIYGVLEKQFRRYYELASRQKGITGENLLQLLESRLDNVVFRSGFSTSRTQARQAVRHGHVLVNGRRVDVPSYRVKEGSVIGIAPQSQNIPFFTWIVQGRVGGEAPSWISADRAKLTAKVERLPARDEIDLTIQEKFIVELYSK